jgi:hypothetical protein
MPGDERGAMFDFPLVFSYTRDLAKPRVYEEVLVCFWHAIRVRARCYVWRAARVKCVGCREAQFV